MQLKVSDAGEIQAYATLGQIDGGQAYDGAVPDDFSDNFKPGWYKLTDGVIVTNPDYQEPTLEPTGPTDQDQINAQLTKQLAATTKTAEIAQSAVVALTKQLAAQAKEA